PELTTPQLHDLRINPNDGLAEHLSPPVNVVLCSRRQKTGKDGHHGAGRYCGRASVTRPSGKRGGTRAPSSARNQPSSGNSDSSASEFQGSKCTRYPSTLSSDLSTARSGFGLLHSFS